jgi:hypothetical protein
MSPRDADQWAMLKLAQDKAHTLLAKLIEQQREIEADPPQLPPEQRAAGQAIFGKAIESARRAVKAIDEAVGTAAGPHN